MMLHYKFLPWHSSQKSKDRLIGLDTILKDPVKNVVLFASTNLDFVGIGILDA